jgi:hypothetical protein
MTCPAEFHYFFTREHVLRDAWNRVSALLDQPVTRRTARVPPPQNREGHFAPDARSAPIHGDSSLGGESFSRGLRAEQARSQQIHLVER